MTERRQGDNTRYLHGQARRKDDWTLTGKGTGKILEKHKLSISGTDVKQRERQNSELRKKRDSGEISQQ